MSTSASGTVEGTPVGVSAPTSERFLGIVHGKPDGRQCWLTPDEFAELPLASMFPWRQPTRARGGKAPAPEVMPAYEGMRSRHVVLPADMLEGSLWAVESRAEADVTRLLIFLGLVERVVPQSVRVVLPDGGKRTIDLCGIDADGVKVLVSVTEPGESDKRADLDALDAYLGDAGIGHQVRVTPSVTVRNNLELWWMHRAWVPDYEEWIDAVVDCAVSEGTTMRYLRDFASPCEEDRGWLVLTALYLLARRVLVQVDGLDVEFGPDRLLVLHRGAEA